MVVLWVSDTPVLYIDVFLQAMSNWRPIGNGMGFTVEV